MKHDDIAHGSASGDELLARTLRTVAILVAACVLFVGGVSLIAVLVTSRAVGSGTADVKTTEANATPKKPLSI